MLGCPGDRPAQSNTREGRFRERLRRPGLRNRPHKSDDLLRPQIRGMKRHARNTEQGAANRRLFVALAPGPKAPTKRQREVLRQAASLAAARRFFYAEIVEPDAGFIRLGLRLGACNPQADLSSCANHARRRLGVRRDTDLEDSRALEARAPADQTLSRE